MEAVVRILEIANYRVSRCENRETVMKVVVWSPGDTRLAFVVSADGIAAQAVVTNTMCIPMELPWSSFGKQDRGAPEGWLWGTVQMRSKESSTIAAIGNDTAWVTLNGIEKTLKMSTPTLPREMKAQVLEAYNQPYTLKTLPLPTIASDDDLLIKVDAASYCHTDAVLAAGQMRPNPPSFPHIGSHEFAGTVIAASQSPSTLAKQYRIGQRVGVPGRAFHPCGNCFECKDTSGPESDYDGYSVYCSKALNNGISRAGGFAEYAVVDARQIAPLPDAIAAVEAAPLMCAGVTIYGALKRCKLSPGQRVGIIGAGGGLGHLGLQFAAAMDLRVTGVDAADEPLKLARSLDTGASIIDSRTQDADEFVQELGAEDRETDRAGMGLDAVIILPEGQSGFDYGMRLLRNHGMCVVVSFPEKGFQVSARDLVFRDIRVIGSLVGSNATLREMLDFAAKHNVRAVTKSFALDNLNGLVEEYHKGSGGKLAIDMTL